MPKKARRAAPVLPPARVVPWTVEEVALEQLTPHPMNPRQGDVGAIHESIRANDFYGVVIAQRSTGHILAGNHRYKAAKAAGLVKVPTMWLDVDDAKARRILLVDNRDADLASYDEAARVAALQAILAEAGSLAGTGYDLDDLDELLRDLGGDDPYKTLVEGTDQTGAGIGFAVTVIVQTAEQRDQLVEDLTARGLVPMVKVAHVEDA